MHNRLEIIDNRHRQNKGMSITTTYTHVDIDIEDSIIEGERVVKVYLQ